MSLAINMMAGITANNMMVIVLAMVLTPVVVVCLNHLLLLLYTLNIFFAIFLHII